MPGPELRLLDDGANLLPALQVSAHVVGFMADDDSDGLRTDPGRRPENVIDQRQPGDAVQDLGHGRPHTSPLAGSQDNDVEGLHVSSFG